MIELIGMIATTLAITGVILNNRRRRACFLLWLVSNGLTLIIHAQTGIWSLVMRDAIFLVLAVEGWLKWSKAPAVLRPEGQEGVALTCKSKEKSRRDL